LPDAFNDAAKLTKSYIPAMNVPARIEIQNKTKAANESDPRQKRGRPIGSKDLAPRKKKLNNISHSKTPEEVAPDVASHKEKIYDGPEDVMNQGPSFSKIKHIAPVEDMPQILEVTGNEVPVPNNNEISVFYTYSGEFWNRKEFLMDDTFSYAMANEIIKYDNKHIRKSDDNEDNTEPRTIQECRQRKDWPKWKDAIQAELDSLKKRGVFGPVVQTPKGINPVGFK
jgi:hypothetical protein